MVVYSSQSNANMYLDKRTAMNIITNPNNRGYGDVPFINNLARVLGLPFAEHFVQYIRGVHTPNEECKLNPTVHLLRQIASMKKIYVLTIALELDDDRVVLDTLQRMDEDKNEPHISWFPELSKSVTSLRCLRHLKSRGFDISEQDLIRATSRDDRECVEYILGKGIPVTGQVIIHIFSFPHSVEMRFALTLLFFKRVCSGCFKPPRRYDEDAMKRACEEEDIVSIAHIALYNRSLLRSKIENYKGSYMDSKQPLHPSPIEVIKHVMR